MNAPNTDQIMNTPTPDLIEAAGERKGEEDIALIGVTNPDPEGKILFWRPAEIFACNSEGHRDFAIVVLNQPLELRASFYAKVWKNSSYCIGADGGANRLYDLDKSSVPEDTLNLDTVIGDLDSIRPEVKDYWHSKGSNIIHDEDQYSTDFTKAVRYLRSFEVPQGATELKSDKSPGEMRNETKSIKNIVAVGGIGGRVDQGMSTLHHLCTFQDEQVGSQMGRIFLLSSEAMSFVLKCGRHLIKVKDNYPEMGLGKHIGIIPLKGPSYITTRGLEWDVTNWLTEFGGQMSTSNHVREDWVTILTTADVLFTIDLRVPYGMDDVSDVSGDHKPNSVGV